MNLEDGIRMGLDALGITEASIPSNRKNITLETVVKALSQLGNLATDLGYKSIGGGSGGSKFVKKLLPNKPSKIRAYTYVLLAADLRICHQCSNVTDVADFSPSATECKECANKRVTKYWKDNPELNRAHDAKYRAAKLNRTPEWSDNDKIKEIYAKCPEGHHVDHIIPLQGELVSGLHVPENLQYLPASENCSKGNRFNIE